MKELSEMSLEELWQLFPIVLKEYDQRYPAWYEKERKAIVSLLGEETIRRISHIGSTAVPGLQSKPTVDILLEISEDCPPGPLCAALQKSGWTLMLEQQKPEFRLAFNKGYTPQGFAQQVYHLHVRHFGNWGELYFRDYLCAHPEEASAYAALKMELGQRYRHDRDGYTAAKAEFVRRCTCLARAEFAGRYRPDQCSKM